jgi:hypothetical protein
MLLAGLQCAFSASFIDRRWCSSRTSRPTSSSPSINERGEREILVDPAELYLEGIVLDDGSTEVFEIEACDVDVDQQPPQRAIDDWQLAAERYESQKNASQFRLVTGT